ncbi:MAG TPA: hypothetical protein VF230_04220 [Acidimicrobiales bacterium]
MSLPPDDDPLVEGAAPDVDDEDDDDEEEDESDPDVDGVAVDGPAAVSDVVDDVLAAGRLSVL